MASLGDSNRFFLSQGHIYWQEVQDEVGKGIKSPGMKLPSAAYTQHPALPPCQGHTRIDCFPYAWWHLVV